MVSLELIRRIRVQISSVEKRRLLIQDKQKWGRITAALDVLEDTYCAIRYYVDSVYPSDLGGKYLFTYGLLQSLFVQSDAVYHLSFALDNAKIDFAKDYSAAYRVREIRNDVTGHPIQRGAGDHIHLIQMSICKESLRYIKISSELSNSECVTVELFSAIADMATCANKILQNLVDEMDKEFKQYIEQHRGRKMKEIFKSLLYVKEKTLTDDYMNKWGYSETKSMVKKCEEELTRRYGSPGTVDAYKYLLEEIHDIYELIDDGLPRLAVDLDDRVEKYLLQLLFFKLDELYKLAEDTDRYFENYGEG